MPKGWFETDSETRRKLKDFCEKNEGKEFDLVTPHAKGKFKAWHCKVPDPSVNEIQIRLKETTGSQGEITLEARGEFKNEDGVEYAEGYVLDVEDDQFMYDFINKAVGKTAKKVKPMQGSNTRSLMEGFKLRGRVLWLD